MEKTRKEKIKEYLNNEREFSVDLINIEIAIDNGGYSGCKDGFTGYDGLVFEKAIFAKYKKEIKDQLKQKISNFCKINNLFTLRAKLKISLLPISLLIDTEIYYLDDKLFSLEPIFVIQDEEKDDLTLICETVIESFKNNDINEIKSLIFEYRNMELFTKKENKSHNQNKFFLKSNFLINFIRDNNHILKIKFLSIHQTTNDKSEFNFRFFNEHDKEFTTNYFYLPSTPQELFSILCLSKFWNIPYEQIKDKNTYDVLEIVNLIEY